MKHRFIALVGWLLLGCRLLSAQTSYTCQYWFDGNYSSHFDTTATSGHWHALIETGHLPLGLHTLFIHLQDTSGQWSSPRSFLFYRTEDTLPGNAASYACWFDQDRNGTLQQGTLSNGTLLIETAAIANGLHTFNLQLGEGYAAQLQSFLFFKAPVVDSGSIEASYTCWFDQDRSGSLHQGTIGNGSLLIDVSTVSNGLHTFNLQLGDGRLARLQSFLFYKVPMTVSDSTLQMTYSCWFDQDTSTMQSGNVASGHLLIDAADISVGLHTLNLQLNAGNLTQLQSYMFYRMPILDTNSAQMVYRCWFDQDYAQVQQGNIGNGHLLLETSHLSDGLHTLNLELGSGRTAQLSSHLFYRIPVQSSSELADTYSLWFDQDYSTLQQGNIGNGQLLIETDSLADGLHTLNLQLGNGRTAQLSSHLFMKMASLVSISDTTPLRWHYSIDGRDYPPISVSRNGGLIHLELDVSTLPDGLHTLSHFFMTQQGTTFGVQSSLFYKIPLGGNGVKRYEYWFNDDYDNRVAAVLDTVADPFRLVRLLDVDTLSFRSSSFQFDPNGGSPRCYAKNKVTFRFIDAMYRYASQSAEFVDQRVMRVVTADTLERDTTKVIAAPQGNSIHWFKLYAGVGDSLSFHTDRPCTIQLFAPSGEEVLSTSGQNVLTWTGCHAWEDGVYHLAVHDAEGTGPLSVSYQWIYRYAVLAWDVHRVGNGGISTITFEGNGFDNLDTVFLVKGSDSIPALFLDHKSNTTAGIVFNFEGADTGMYHAVFVYVDETLYVPNTIRVETALPIVLTSNVSYPTTFLRGSSVTYTYEITNTGNMTAYNVPLYTCIGSHLLNNITHIKFDGLNLPSFIADMNLDSLSENEKQELQDWAEEMGDDHYFFKIRAYDSIIGDSIWVRSNYFFLTIAPYETQTLALEITSSAYIDVWFTLPDAIPPLVFPTFDTMPQPLLMMSKITKSNSGICCVKEQLECSIDLFCHYLDRGSVISMDVAIAAGLISIGTFNPELLAGAGFVAGVSALDGAFSCMCSFLSSEFKIIGNISCNGINGSNTPERIRTAIEKNNKSLITTLFNCILQTLKAIGSAYTTVNHWREVYQASEFGALYVLNAYVNGGDGSYDPLIDCISEFSKLKPNCIPIPPKGGKAIPVVPVDPNEITGYIAESGSHAIGAEVMQLPYMIEFENDTAFATANAHTVVVRDTLDGSVFDLSSFSATAFAIGDETTPISGEQRFTRTVDMRPAIDALAQVQLDYHIDTSFAVATWTFTSLDPMTLLPSADSLGFLGIGNTGEVNFSINRKANLPDSTMIDNRAWITFDNEEPIATSTWRNIIDITPPVSSIDSIAYSGSTATVTINATDNLSGVWRYNVYAQMDGDVMLPMAMNVPADSAAVFTTPDEVVQFRSTAIDSAGNVEPLVRTPLITTVYDTTTITACDNFDWMDSTYTISGEYTQRKTASVRNAPDTLSTLLLTINRSTASMETATACDSYTWHGNTYTSSTNTPTYSTNNAVGCDSTVTLHLTVNHSNSGDTTATACDSFTWWNTNYSNSTNGAMHVLTNAAGCDSTITLHLTVNHSTTSIETVTACDSFTWWNTNYSNSTNGAMHVLTNAAGCDSTITLHLTVNHSTTSIETVTACDSFTWWNTNYTNSTNGATHVLTNAAGCDSTVTLHLTVNHSSSGDTTATACDSFTWWNTNYTNSTNGATHVLTNAAGCDSTVTLHLTVNHSNSGDTTATACDSFTWWNTNYTNSTNGATHVLTNAYGCDSTVTLHLTVNHSTSGIESVTACDSYTWHDSTYTATTLNSQFSILNSQGCDSTVTLHLTLNHSDTSRLAETVCQGDSILFGGSWLRTGGVYADSLQTAQGCDSVIVLTLTVNPVSESTFFDTACDSYTWHDSTYTASTLNSQFVTLNSLGCDSIIHLALTVNYSTRDTIADSASGSYTWLGNTYTESGDYLYVGQTTAGCDSVVVLRLTITQVGISAPDSLGGIRAYPNPTRGLITIEGQQMEGVEVFDAAGRRVAQFKFEGRTSKASIDIHHLPTGVYTLRIGLADGHAVRRMFKR